MNQELWLAVKALFNEVAELPAAEANRRLEQSTQAEVAAEVRKLLAAESLAEQAGFLNELDTPPHPDLLSDTDDSIAPQDTPVGKERRVGTRVGNYRITEFIAQGGMGAVYKAVRDEDYEQIVAIKILRDSLDSPLLVARFHRERQAMARLSHPGIARLLDGGTTSDDLPFLVMEYIDGPRLLRYCKDRSLSIRDKIVLFQAIVEAVTYANSQSILHRDLKPSNIMVRSNGTPVVTDFGLARPFETSDFSTQTAAILGTPSYMAPEQITGGNATSVQIDVYGLGAILYELLTDRPPFKAESPLQTMRLVRNAMPQQPRTLVPGLHKDVETICLKCLEKEPLKRLASANELKGEIDRWLAGRPILSRPVGVGGRFARWARRNPALAAVITGATALLIGALVTVTLSWQSARADKARAERNLTTAREAIRTLVRQTEALRLQPGQEQIRLDNLKTALAFYAQIAADYPNDESALDELARANFRLGELMSQGRSQAEAADYFRKSIDDWDRLQSRFPEKPEYPYELYRAYWLRADLPNSGMPTGEKILLRQKAYRILEDLTAQFPDDPRYWDSLAALCPSMAGNHWETDPAKGIAFLQHGFDVAMMLDRKFPEGRHYIGNAGRNLQDMASANASHFGKYPLALEQFQRSLDIAIELNRRFPTNLDYQDNLAIAKSMFAEYLSKTNETARAELLFREALVVFDSQIDISPSLPAIFVRPCFTRMLLANLLAENGRASEASENYRQTLQKLNHALTLQNMHIDIPNIYARHLLECPLAEFRDPVKAAQMIARLQELLTTGEKGTAEISGKLHFRQKNYAAALSAFAECKMNYNIETIDVRYIIAMCLSRLGRNQEATTAFATASKAAAVLQQIGHWKSVWQKEAESQFGN